MLVCAKCEFENPEQNRFCQNCGHPLRLVTALIMRQAIEGVNHGEFQDFKADGSSNAAPSTDEAVNAAFFKPVPSAVTVSAKPDDTGQSAPPLDADAATSTVDETLEVGETSHQSDSQASPTGPTQTSLSTTFAHGQFLDEAQRYQIQAPVTLSLLLGQEIEIKVVDCYPGDPSPLDVIQTALLETDASTESVETHLLEQLPTAAHPYLKLQNELFPVLPELYSAWQEGEYTVLLLETRTQLIDLSNIWQAQDTDPLQHVHWLFEMTDLWHALESWQGQASLLKPNNLGVDEDQILCLHRLYPQPRENPHQLTDLGLFWEELLQTSPNDSEALEQLAHEVATGKIDQLKVIQSKLAQIADELQAQGESELELETALASETHLDAVQAKHRADQQTGPSSDPSTTDLIHPSKGSVPNSLDQDEAEFESLLDEANEGVTTTIPDIASFLLGTDTNPNTAFQDDDEAEFADSTMVLPMILVGLSEAGQTHVGQQRDHNEDSFYISTELSKQEMPHSRTLSAKGLYILCDGMGGHEGGEVASALAVKTLQTYFEQNWDDELPLESSIQAAIAEANRAIYSLNLEDERSGSGRMGTTLVMVLLQNTQAVVAHVGDSRLYRYSRRLGLQQVTVDHEVGQREIKRGVEPAIAYARPDAYQLTQALGPRDSEDIRPSISYLDLNEDTLFVLCSDGLSDNDVLETHYQSHVEPLLRSRHDLEEGVADLIELANTHNGHDNITVIAVRVKVRPNLEKLPQ